MAPFIARKRPPEAPRSGEVRAHPSPAPFVDPARTGRTWRVVRELTTCVTVAVSNLFDQRGRTIAAISGVAVALLLLLLQISILSGARHKVTELYDDYDFDVAIVPDTYQFLMSFNTVDRLVLDIARATGDVADTYGLNVDVVHWTILPSHATAHNLILGVDPPAGFVKDKAMRDAWPLLGSPHSIVADKYSQIAAAGPVTPGSEVEIKGERLTVRGQFKLGLFFYAEGATLVRNVDFPRLTGRDPNSISMGLVKLKPGVSPEKGRADIAAALPSGTMVLTKSQLIKQERQYFISTKPIGIMMYISMIIASLIAVAIVLQVLSTEIANRMGEYAVLKAMGATPALVYGIGLSQAVVVSFGGLAPALGLGAIVLWLLQLRTHLDTVVAAPMVLRMVLITSGLAIVAAALVVRRVVRADPASLY